MSNTNIASFKEQFSLTKGKDKNDILSNNYSYLNAPTTYNNKEITPNDMHPFNYMDMYKADKDNSVRQSGRRDATIFINNYYGQEAGQYATPKKEINYLFEPVENLNATAGDTRILDKIGTERYLDTLKYKQNDYDPTKMYVRPELIDGPPMTEVVRPREKTQQELRGYGVNSIRLDSEGRNNQTGKTGEGVSTAPSDINITKYKMLSYRTQDSIDDLLRTTGLITRPEWRSLIRDSLSERSYMKTIDGPAVSSVMRTEYHNEQAARPTLKENTIVNNYLSNAYNQTTGNEYRNEQLARPTNKENTIINKYLSNIFSQTAGDIYRNNQLSKPTIREDYQNNTNIINPKSTVDQYTYRNNQTANPTIREDYQNNTNITNPKAVVDQAIYRNEQLSNPTLREDFNKYINHGNNNTAGYAYENNMSANPTNRTQLNEFSGASYNNTAGNVYQNNQSANPTNRTQDNNFDGPGFNQTNGTYKLYNDKTRSGVVEEVLAKDYNGPEFSFVTRDESRLQFANMVQNDAIENSINLVNHDLMGGGTDRIPQGKDNIGLYDDRNRREKNKPLMNRARNIGVNYIEEVPETRGYNILQERSAINQYVPETLSQNPFINNVDYKATYNRDLIRENTIISDRNFNRK
jgi:hypothetical protein